MKGPSSDSARPAREVGVQTALLLALVDGEEIRVLDASDIEVTVEVSDPLPDALSLSLAIFDLPRWDYTRFRFDDCRVIERRRQPYSQICRLAVGRGERVGDGDASYAECLAQLKAMWRTSPHRDGRAPRGVGSANDYADVERRRSYHTYAEQRHAWFAPRPADAEQRRRFAELAGSIEHAFAVCTPAGYDALLEHGCRAAIARSLDQLGLRDHPLLARAEFARLYVGNAFCPHLSPKPERLATMLERAHAEGFALTVTAPQLIEHTVEPAAALLDQLEATCSRIGAAAEIVVNDWGMLDLLADRAPSLTPTLGRLLNKRKKDPRARWYWGAERHTADLEKNNLGASWYREFLGELGIARFELEAGPMRAHVPSVGHSLHYPFYYTNASVFCMLHAELTEFYAGKQRLVKTCPRYCADFCYLYPDHLRLVGKGNAIFGFDADILVDAAALERYAAAGVDRLVFTPDC